MAGSFDEIKRKLLEGYVRSSPLMDMMYRADEAGVGNMLNPRNKPPRGPDILQLKRQSMSESEYRRWLLEQRQLGEHQANQPLEVKPPK